MIRREQADDWLLISQIDHARLAGSIAAVWGNADVAVLSRHDELVRVVNLHDEGWADWERQPQVDPKIGFPRSFIEMPMEVSTALWRESIHICGEGGPLSAMWASRHFCRLGAMALDYREDVLDRAATKVFLTDQVARQKSWHQELSEEERELETVGTDYLALFDRLSLWLTVDEPEEDLVAPLPSGGEVRFSMNVSGEVRIDPWPLSVLELCVDVPAHRLKAGLYSQDAFDTALAQAIVEPLVFRFERG